MRIALTPEQEKEFLDDGWIEVTGGNNRIYAEYSPDGYFEYGEIVYSKNCKTIKGYAFDSYKLDKMEPRRVIRSSYYHFEPQCPNCATMMIYKFECCPKCGQKLDWSEE